MRLDLVTMTLNDLLDDGELLVFDPINDVVIAPSSIMVMVQASDGTLWRSREEIAAMSDLEAERDVIAIRFNEELHL